MPAEAAAAVRELSRGAGADVVLELVGAPAMPTSLEALARQGRLVVVGVAQGDTMTINLRTLMVLRAKLIGTVLRARPVEEKAMAVRNFDKEMGPALAAGRVAPVVDRAFHLADVREAFTHMEQATKAGKVLLDVAAGER